MGEAEGEVEAMGLFLMGSAPENQCLGSVLFGPLQALLDEGSADPAASVGSSDGQSSQLSLSRARHLPAGGTWRVVDDHSDHLLISGDVDRPYLRASSTSPTV